MRSFLTLGLCLRGETEARIMVWLIVQFEISG